MSQNSGKRTRTDEADRFVALPDDLLITILAKVASGAASPADLANARMTFSRFRDLGYNSAVLKNASASCIAVRPKNWSIHAQHFLKCCAEAGNDGASYLLGMILFYCIGDHQGGADLIADAALQDNCYAIYSLAVIMFNGSGGTREDRNILAGAGLCSSAARLGHLEALRELGFCLIDGYGLNRSVMNGRRLLLQATARELSPVAALSYARRAPPQMILAGMHSGLHQGTSIEGKTWTTLIQPSSNLYYAAILDVVAEKLDARNSGHAPDAARLSSVLALAGQHTRKAVHGVSCGRMVQADQANGADGGHEAADEAVQALDV
ncbi:F-box protein At1g67340-like [Lolium rigidum]|uniref:F-box protein At1g67340-like n=1 Tax=Lolium rigidum TaxID=89674 RepID=UPI001F5DEFB5|nr:F-box protein At1g67340-like [Lolium rigidum]